MKKTNLMAGIISCLFGATAMMPAANAQTDWHLTGNAGTTSTSFLGTTDAKGLTIKTNNSKRITITSGGKVGIGTATPGYKLDVFGGTNGSDTLAVIHSLVKKTGNFDIPAILGVSQPAAGYGIGIHGVGNFIGLVGDGGVYGVVAVGGTVGVDGEASEAGSTTDLTGVQGLVSGGNISIGVYGNATGAVNNYAVYGEQTDTAGPNYAVVGLGDVFGWRFFQASDRKLKNNIQPLTGVLDKVNQLVTATYTFDHAKYPGNALPAGKQIGFMADNIESLFPELIKNGDLPTGSTRDARGKVTYHTIPDVKTVNYIGMIPVLAEAIKEQKQIVDQKDVVIAQQNDRIERLESQVAQLVGLMEQSGQITPAQKNALVKSADNAKLFQNQPNPANGSTVISFYIPANATSAMINITNGQSSVLSIPVSQRGNGQVTVNANDFATGTYNYSLVIDGKIIDTKGMILAK